MVKIGHDALKWATDFIAMVDSKMPRREGQIEAVVAGAFSQKTRGCSLMHSFRRGPLASRLQLHINLKQERNQREGLSEFNERFIIEDTVDGCS